MKKQLRYRYPLLIATGVFLVLLYGCFTLQAWQNHNKARFLIRGLITLIWGLFTVLNIIQYRRQRKARNNTQ